MQSHMPLYFTQNTTMPHHIHPMRPVFTACVAILLSLLPLTGLQAADAPVQPIQSGRASKAMVVTAHPLASRAGIEALAAGGTAADAAVAIQAVLTLVEPQSSGFGGGAFAVHWSGRDLLLDTYDGRETAPMAARDNLFLTPEGAPMDFTKAFIGGRAVGTPGTLRLLERMHRDHGALPFRTLLQPAIDLARDGFAVSQRLHDSIGKAEGLSNDQTAFTYFFNTEGEPWPVGHILKNPDYAALLEAVADQGVDAFYNGRIAEDIVAKVTGHSTNPGLLSTGDFARYRAIRRSAVCAPFRDLRICGMGPPSSGALTVGQILGMVGQFLPDDHDERARVMGAHRYVEAARLAYADRARYMADADFVPVPVKALVDPDYLDRRAGQMSLDQASVGPAIADDWPATQLETRLDAGIDPRQKNSGTSHFVVVDGSGNVLSYTGSIEMAFGARQMVHGILLNNELTDFSFAPRDRAGALIANRVQPGKRPRSSMSPTIVFDAAWHPVLAVGSPGGSRIINYVAQSIIDILDYGYEPAGAFAKPHVGSRNGPVEVENRGDAYPIAQALSQMGHEVRVTTMESGLHGILIRDGELIGGADPRREGHVIGLD
ncbi:MAG: gamma-glutamyltransferase [Alphaproteobacteria bacterium]|nr:gamma-glutamyltransferase [Alphaproteobacteria bacterium]MAS46541.1 gamma-glutamyltransferase [Alphaproteobacteria bacterium]MAX94635.1 gamma-glutamyltransferase [Alphaproteobacteria bacterium]MBN53913.1 gamma-glutamyltransferase [Alphaproteobacteria bacterium]